MSEQLISPTEVERRTSLSRSEIDAWIAQQIRDWRDRDFTDPEVPPQVRDGYAERQIATERETA